MSYRTRRKTRKSKDDNSAGGCCCLLFIFICLVIGFSTLPSSPSDLPPSRNSTTNSSTPNIQVPPNGTYVSAVPCNDSNWSAGSAFFTLTALTFGYYAHPPGSIFLLDSRRTWRLSPIFALTETIILVKRLIQGLREGYTFRVVCFALLTVRLSNSCRDTEEVAVFIENHSTTSPPSSPEEHNPQQPTTATIPSETSPSSPIQSTRHGSRDINESAETDLEAAPKSDQGAIDSSVEEDMYSPPSSPEEHNPQQPTTATIPLETSPSSPIQSTRHDSRDINESAEADLEAASKSDQGAIDSSVEEDVYHQDAVFRGHIRLVEKFEHGPSVRCFIWIPMMLQLFKITVVSGAPLSQTLCALYFFAWLVVEILMVTAASRPLEETEYQAVFRLGGRWRKIFETPFVRTKHGKFGPPEHGIGLLIVLLLSAGNIIYSFVLFFRSYSFRAGEGDDVLGRAFLDSFVVLLVPFVFLALIMPWVLWILVGIYDLVWNHSGLSAVFGPSSFGDKDEGLNSSAFTSIWVAYPSLYGWILLLRYYIVDYDCVGTVKPSWYDWLG